MVKAAPNVPRLTAFAPEHSAQIQAEPFLERIITAAMEVCAAQTGAARSAGLMPEPLTAAQLRILKLLPTTTYPRSRPPFTSRTTR
jgi:LuxR family transcriptional regulator, maltose regulon positive regulatory protein